MQLIERFFGLYPDGGNGLLEFNLFAILLIVASLWFVMPRSTKRGKRRTDADRT